MKTKILTFALAIFLSACAVTSEPRAQHESARTERVSDRYSRDAVKSYKLFDAAIDGHVLMLARLTTGEQFPMLCRNVGNSIEAIPQSVFAERGADKWDIMCEPRIRNAYALMRLKVSRREGALFLDDRKLKPVTKVPLR